MLKVFYIDDEFLKSRYVNCKIEICKEINEYDENISYKQFSTIESFESEMEDYLNGDKLLKIVNSKETITREDLKIEIVNNIQETNILKIKQVLEFVKC